MNLAKISTITLIERVKTNCLFYLSMGLFTLCLFNDGYYISGQNPRAWAPAWGILLVV